MTSPALAIQLARLSGFYPIITTASEHNTDLLQSKGATHVFSRNLSLSALETSIKEITKGEFIKIVFDTVSSPETQQLGWDLLGRGGSIITVLDPNMNKKGQDGEKQVVHVFCNVQAPQNRAVGRKLYGKLTEWLEKGIILVCYRDYSVD